MAGVVGSFVGMIHGTKSIGESKAPSLAKLGLLDDPLNGPWFIDGFSNPRRVRWQDAHGFVAPGAGDLFANLVLSDGSETYRPWRDRFMMCSAMSMREAYETGPKAHGPLTSFLGKFDLDDFDFETECWSQRATNESMLGSVLPIPLAYNTPVSVPWNNALEPVGPAVFAFFNHVVIDKLSETPAMPSEADRMAFIRGIERRMLLDQQSVVFDYLGNVTLEALGNVAPGALGNLDGTESAQGRRVAPLGSDNLIRFLGVEPNRELPGTPPVSFMDLPEPSVPEGDRPQSYYVRRMFWRAHPEDSCEVPGLAAQLRDACVAGAEEPGGDPEACTRCVEVTELQMTTCGLNGPVNGPSKCTAMGLESLGGIEPRYQTSDCATELGLDALPAYYSAFHYCTGTDPVSLRNGSLIGERVLSIAPPVQIDCSVYPGFDEFFDNKFHNHIPARRVRYALVIDENDYQGQVEAGAQGDPSTFLPPIVTALINERTSTIIDEAIFCGLGPNPWDFLIPGTRVESSLDPMVEAQIQPLQLWDNFTKGVHALAPFDQGRPDTLQFERCGVTQRASYHNRDCFTTLSALGRSDLTNKIDTGYDPATGVDVRLTIAADELRCSVREELELKTLCADGACNANGLCSRFEPAPVVLFHAN